MTINTTNWKSFRYDEVFILQKGKRLTKDDMVTGTIPFIGATEINNGITAYVNTAIFPKNSISVSYNGSVAEAFYHEYEYWGSDDIHCLTLKNQIIDDYLGIYICSVIKIEKYRFNYGRKWNMDRMRESIIKLPINTQGNPDWDYMRAYIKNTISQSTPKIQLALKNIIELEKSVLSQETPVLDITTWKEFKYDEIFDISRGNSTYDESIIEKQGYPLIGASQNENGCGGEYVEFYDYDGLFITVGNGGNTGCGQTFFQSGKFSAKSTANLLQLKEHHLNQYIAMFLVTLIKKEQYRYNFGRGWGLDRMKKSTIKLPVDAQGNPDWDYMENYIKTLKYSASI